MKLSFRAPARCAAAALVLVLLGGCDGGGSGDDSDDIDMPSAFNVLGQSGYSGAHPNRGGVPAANTLAQPLGSVAVVSDAMFVADSANNRVLGYRSVPLDRGAAADFVLGQPNAATTSPGTGARKFALSSSVFASQGYLVVTDSGNNRVLIWNSVPTSGDVDPDVVVGQTGLVSNSAGTTASTLSFPTAAIIANNRLLVVDQSNNRVLIWTSVPTAHGQAADLVLGQADFTSRDADDEADEMNRPAGIWSDGFQLLVADAGNHRVLYWVQVPQASGTAADYVMGQTAFSRSGAGSSAAGMRTPFGVASDGTRIYVADAGNHRVLRFDSFPISNGSSANEVFGQDDFSHTAANDDDQDGDVDDNPTARTLSGPTGVLTASGVLYVTDRNNNRILFFPQ